MNSDRVKRILEKIPLHIVIMTLVLVWLVPTVGVFVTSFRSRQAVRQSGWWTAFSGPPTPGQQEYSVACGSCHGENAMVGLDLTSYQTTMQGGENGPVVIIGDPTESLLILKQSGSKPHFGQFSPKELELMTEWIEAGAPEK